MKFARHFDDEESYKELSFQITELKDKSDFRRCVYIEKGNKHLTIDYYTKDGLSMLDIKKIIKFIAPDIEIEYELLHD